MEFLDSSAKLASAVKGGDWIVVLDFIRGLSIPDDLLVDLYEHICIEFLEKSEFDVVETLLFATTPLSVLKYGDPVSSMRFRRLETALVARSNVLENAYRGMTRHSRRDELAEKLMSHLESVPSARLITMLGDSVRFRVQREGLQAHRRKFDMLRGVFRSDSTTFVTTVLTQFTIPGDSRPKTAAFHPGGRYLVVGSSDGLIEVYSVSDWKVADDLPYQARGEFLIHDACVTALSFDQTGSRLASGDNTGKLCVWDFHSGDRMKEVQSSPRGVITCLRLDTEGNRIYVASGDGFVRIHGLKSGSVLKEFAIAESVSAHGRFSITGFFCSGGTDGILRAYSCQSCTIHREMTFPGSGTHVIRGVDIINRLENQESVIVTYDAAPTVMYDMLSGHVLREFSIPDIGAGDSFIYSTPSPNCEYLYCISTRGKLYCFEIDSAKLVNVVPSFKGEVVTAIHHPNRAILIVVSSDGTVYVIGN